MGLQTEVLARFGTKAQKEKYLLKLLSGETRSSFSMTELGGMFSVAPWRSDAHSSRFV
jgi:alkylation response protein AidB-like acyl-CoA dehydrogenase